MPTDHVDDARTLLVEVTRGALVESRHRGALAVVAWDGRGELLAAPGDPFTVAYLRSAAKPFQALPTVTAGALEHFGLGPEELAVMCGSHHGTPEHVALVTRLGGDGRVLGQRGIRCTKGLWALLQAVTREELDVVLTWSVNRLGRSLKDLLLLFEELRASGADLYLDQQAVDASAPAGKALLQMAAILAALEQAMLVERTKAGLARARRQGKRLGRPPATAAVERRVRELRAQRLGMVAIGRRRGIGTGVVPRICKAATPSEAGHDRGPLARP